MPGNRNIPYTTSELIDSVDRRIVDLTEAVFPEIPVLGMNQRGARLHWVFFRLPEKGKTVFGLPLKESQFLVHELMNMPRRAFVVNDDVRLAFLRLLYVIATRFRQETGMTPKQWREGQENVD